MVDLSTNQAATIPTRAHRGTVTTTRETVFSRSSATLGRHSSRDRVGPPVDTAVTTT